MEVLYTIKPLKLVVQGQCVPTTFVGLPYLVNNQMQLVKPVNTYLRENIILNGSWRSVKTWRTYANALYEYFSYLEDNQLDWQKADAQLMGAWRDFMLKQGASGQGNHVNTVRQRMLCVDNFYQWALKEQLITQLPFIFKTLWLRSHGINFNQLHPAKTLTINNSAPRNIPTDTRIPTTGEFTAFVRALKSKRDKLIAWTIRETGLRKDEIITLNWDAVPKIEHLEKPCALKMQLNPNKMRTKGSKARWVEISSTLAYELSLYILGERPLLAKLYKQHYGKEPTTLFISNRGKLLSETTINAAFTKASVKANLGFIISVHLLRHMYATYTLCFEQKRFGGETQTLLWLSKRLGHNSVVTTRDYYIHLLPNVLIQDQLLLDHYHFVLASNISENIHA